MCRTRQGRIADVAVKNAQLCTKSGTRIGKRNELDFQIVVHAVRAHAKTLGMRAGLCWKAGGSCKRADVKKRRVFEKWSDQISSVGYKCDLIDNAKAFGAIR